MKPQIVVFTEHEPATLDRLIAEAKKRGHAIHRGSDFLKFSAHEGLEAVPLPKPKKTVYGTTETDAAVPSMVQRYKLEDYLPEGM
jgi:hypothetical protein